jgi:rhamnosyltransferase
MNLAGVVVLYNPDDDVIANLMSYAHYLKHLYIFDNSPNSHERISSLVSQKTEVLYFWNGENKGLPFCFNKALKLAQNMDCDWLMTMDQDSKFDTNGLRDYISCISKLPSNTYGISPTFQNEVKGKKLPSKLLTVTDICITSGNIINVSIAINCGGFDENLFIDEVDNEFCYRCNQAGYLLYKYNRIILIHHLGNPIPKKILGFNYTALNESYLRQYYIMRNRLYIASKYPKIKGKYYVIILKWIVKIILAEPDKLRKLHYAYKGWKDFRAHKMGKISEN